MNLFITKNDQRLGPYSLADAQNLVAAGTLQPNDWAWYEGLTDWIPLQQVPGFLEAPQPVTAAAPLVTHASVRRPVLVWIICLVYFICIPIGLLSLAATPYLLSFANAQQQRATDTIQDEMNRTNDPAQKERLATVQKQLAESHAQTARITQHTGLYYAMSLVIMAINLIAAVLLFLLRKSALYFFLAAFVAGLLSSVYNWTTVGLPPAHGPAGQIGFIIGMGLVVVIWALMIAILFYIWHLYRRGILR